MAPKQRAKVLGTGEEPPEKKAKTEEAPESKAEDKYVEPDAAKDNRATIKDSIGFEACDLTLNVIPAVGGKTLTALTDAGMCYLLAGARANCGQTAGRYMFEVKIIHSLNLEGSRGGQKPKQALRVGFSTAHSSLLIGDDADSAAFDGEGYFVSDRKRNPSSQGSGQTFGKFNVVAVVLNLDPKSPNKNTMTLFRDGKQVSEPIALPESLQGKALYPHVTFRNVSVHVNFGPTAMCELPFKCSLLQGAAQSDVVSAASPAPKDGKYEVMLPVGFPDEGTFDWLDSFMEKNPKYVELSDRKLADWAQGSGLWTKGTWRSTDKPNLNYPGVDSTALHKMLNTVIPLVPRNYVVMEVMSNLLSKDRTDNLKKFNYPHFKKVAHVVLGEPNADYKKRVQSKILKDKQELANRQWQKERFEKQRKKDAERKQKPQKEVKPEEEIKEEEKKEDEIKTEMDVDEEAKDAKKDDEKKEGEEKAEEDAEKAAGDEKPAEDEEKEEEDDDDAVSPAVELTEEEKELKFLPVRRHDLSPYDMSSSFDQFTFPDKAEGFDEIRFEWDKADKSKDYLKTQVKKIKLNTRLDGLKPGTFFQEKWAEWRKLWQEWQDKQKSYKTTSTKKDDDDDDEVDISKVDNVSDIGDGKPLYAHFEYEDWLMTSSRFEFWLLCVTFVKDCDDPDRVGVPKDHFAFYYNKYFGKHFVAQNYGQKDQDGVVAMFKDVIAQTDEGLLVSSRGDDVDNVDTFLKFTEERRRERQRRIDGGDETARLRFPAPQTAKDSAANWKAGGAPPPPPPIDAGDEGGHRGRDWGRDRGAYGGRDRRDYGAGRDAGKGKGKWGPGKGKR